MTNDTIFLEIVLTDLGAKNSNFESRDEIEDLLEEAFEESGLCEITGAGSGMGRSIIDVEVISPEKLEESLALILSILDEHKAPSNSYIRKPKPVETIYSLKDYKARSAGA